MPLKLKFLYSIDEVVELTGLSRTTIYDAISTGKLRARKCGRRTVVAHDDLMDFIDSLERI
ncbi:helix-turn-helix domain-containing protein [Rhodoblastus sp. 17X3]|uniref:helix-turn-helix domain-containing protein n=1 Tax=Rhodoblastus sp. 17X3 TaxID=3047026 RepID=UPI0024B77343|nr:helix-turn-helix domain-containing protein [Rhodoblastus sp. 17X3]MDI9849538.1 helix-turn-helix domain-containing protein [Rhodoblastus sp. 17X3]